MNASKEYAKAIESTKKEHWENWLLNASERDMWTANKYATDPPQMEEKHESHHSTTLEKMAR